MRVSLAASGAALVAVLSGCSVAGTNFQPGLAATVGDQTVSADEVDRVTTAACGAFGPGLARQNTVVPLRLVKSTVAQDLALASAVRQLGAEYGVQPSPAYQREVAATRATPDLSTAEREAAVVVSSTATLVNDILGQIGAQLAAKTAAGGAAPSATSKEAIQLGGEQLSRWLKQNEVELDPQYGVRITGAGAQAVDSSLAFGVSDAARAGQSDPADPATTMALPATQRCGAYTAGGGTGGGGAAGGGAG